MDGARRDAVLPPTSVTTSASAMVGDHPLLEPPADLSDDAKACWRALAPLALLERTLTASRVPGFRELCIRWVYCGSYDARIWELGGPARHEADPLVKRLEKWRALLGNSLKEFNLTSFGRPATVEKPKAASNPFAGLGRSR